MTRIDSFARDLVMATEGISPGAINAELAKFARRSLSEAIREGTASPLYDRYVNGVHGADESTVKAPGPILYDFHWWTEIVEFAVKTLVERSPVKSGRYRKSWFVSVNGQRVTNYDAIPVGATVHIVNDQPYSRKIDVGFMKMSVPPHVVDDARKMINARFGNVVNTRRTMIHLPNPYILKGVFRKGIRKKAREGLRRDTRAGAEMTYPALMIEMRF